MITTTKIVDDPFSHGTPSTAVVASDSVAFANKMLEALDQAFAQLQKDKVQGQYVKFDDVTDIILDLRLDIEAYTSRN